MSFKPESSVYTRQRNIIRFVPVLVLTFKCKQWIILTYLLRKFTPKPFYQELAFIVYCKTMLLNVYDFSS